MTDLMDISRMRHTVHNYAQRPVEADKLASVLEAGRWAPTAVNAQPQRILVLDDPCSLAKVREFCTFGWREEYVDLAQQCDTPNHDSIVLYYGAPVVLVVCYDSDACWRHPESGERSGSTDAAIVATHIMLQATCLGLGSAWVSYFDKGRARKLLRIPAGWELSSLLCLGYPARDEQPASLSGMRRPLDGTCFFNQTPRSDSTNPAEEQR